MTNPLLEDWSGDFALPPFGAFADDHFAPAIEKALAEARETVAAIAGKPAVSTRTAASIVRKKYSPHRFV